jgi:predicted DNA-binding transcriptional regulator AlpA
MRSNVVLMPDRQQLENLPPDEILTMEEAIAFTKFKRRTLYYHVERGSIPFPQSRAPTPLLTARSARLDGALGR